MSNNQYGTKRHISREAAAPMEYHAIGKPRLWRERGVV
jgi:hypothetical protein